MSRVVKRADVEALAPGDSVEYTVTIEVQSSDRRSKAWVKYGTISAMRTDETTQEACDRIDAFVEGGIRQRVKSWLESM